MTLSAPDRFIVSSLRGRCGMVDQCSPGCKINKLKSFARGEIDQNHVDERILGGEGLQYEGSTSMTFVRAVRYCVQRMLLTSMKDERPLRACTMRCLSIA